MSTSLMYTGAAADQILRICSKEQFAVTPALRTAFFRHARKQVETSLKAGATVLPAEFLAWVESDPDIATGVYAAHHEPEDVLRWLYSLRLDMGKAKFEQYRQLALAVALVSAKEGLAADTTAREPMKLVIPRDPRVRVDTKDPQRELDFNDHIINFLNDHTIEEDVALDPKTGELKYDKRGIALPVPKRKKGDPTCTQGVK